MVILLDIDGVMIPAPSWKVMENMEDGFPMFSQYSVDALNKILTPDSTIILTTSHRLRFSIKQWIDIFKTRGVNVEKILCLETYHDFPSRKIEIERWFDHNDDPNFMIIDDDTRLNALSSTLKQKLILTSPLIGLTVEHLSI